MKKEDLKVGQTLRYSGQPKIYTVKYIGHEVFVVQSSTVESCFYDTILYSFEPFTPPIQVTAYVYFYLNDGKPVHRLCYDETQLANLRAQDSVKHKLSPVTTVETEFK